MSQAKLTAKQEAFCQAIASGMTQADAYRSAYSADKMTDKVVYVKASEMMADGKIAVRVADLRAELEAKQLWSREMSVKGLVAAYKVAQGRNNASGMTGAIKELNAMHGYNEPAKISVNGNLVHKVVRQVIDGTDADD